MTESKAIHQILVLDNDKDFISLLQEELGPNGFEILAVNPESDKIITSNLFQAELIFIAVEAPDMLGYSLYDKARKKVGNYVPIVLTTATLSPKDFSLHSQLKEPADAYLDKRRLVSEGMPPEILKLIGLKSYAMSSHAEVRHDQEINQGAKIMSRLKHLLSDIKSEEAQASERSNKESHDMRPSQPLNYALDQKDQNGQMGREINHFVKKIQEDNERILVDKEKLKKYKKEMYDFEKEIDKDLKRNKELEGLVEITQKMIEEAKKSAEMLAKEKLAHQETRKELESRIAVLQAELIGNKEQYLFQLNASEEKFKANLLKAKEDQQHVLEGLNQTYAEKISQLRTEKNTEIKALKEKVSTEMQKIAEMLTDKEKAYQASNKQYEQKIAHLQAELEDARNQQISQIKAAEDKYKTDLISTEEHHSSIVDSIVKKFAAQMAQVRLDLDKERQTHQKVREDLETKIARLSAQKDPVQEQMDSEQNGTQDKKEEINLLKEDE